MTQRGKGYTEIFTVGHTDVLGNVNTAISGAAQWTEEVVFDSAAANTGWRMRFLRHDQNDFFQIESQFPHSKKLYTNIDLHIHYMPMIAPAASPQNVYFRIKYAWININGAMPLNVNWTTSYATIPILTGHEFTQRIGELLVSVAPPANETYSSILVCQITRMGTDPLDTYDTNKVVPPASGLTAAANLGVMYVDIHYETDHIGSYNETTD